jgi:CheY-like chemotaxis protein
VTAPHRILVVDDNDSLRENLVELLESEGFLVSEASGGQQALAILASGPLPTVALVDMMMPGMTGHELVGRLRAEPRLARLRVVLVTGMVPLRGEVAADSVLSKPFGVDALLDKLRPLLAAAERDGDLERATETA